MFELKGRRSLIIAIRGMKASCRPKAFRVRISRRRDVFSALSREIRKYFLILVRDDQTVCPF